MGFEHLARELLLLALLGRDLVIHILAAVEDLAVEAARGTRVAGDAIALYFLHGVDDRVAVAVDAQTMDLHEVAALLPLHPQPLAGLREEGGVSGLERLLPRLLVGVSGHQNFFGAVLLDDDIDEARNAVDVQPEVRPQDRLRLGQHSSAPILRRAAVCVVSRPQPCHNFFIFTIEPPV